MRHKDVLLARSFCHASFCLLLKQKEEQEQKSSVRKMEEWLPKPTFHQSTRVRCHSYFFLGRKATSRSSFVCR